MGAGTSDTGPVPVILPDVQAPPAPQAPGNDELAALAREARDAVELIKQAAAASDNPMLAHAARQACEATQALERAAATDQVRQAVWEDGFQAGVARCPVPLPEERKPPGHRRPRPGYLRPLAVAAAGAWRITGRHAGAAKAAAVAHAKLTAVITALAVGTTAAGGALVLARAPASHAAASGATAGQVTGGAGVWAADPVGPQQQQPGHAVTRKTAAKGKRLSETDAASPISYPPYSPPPSASPPGSSGPSQSSQPSGSAGVTEGQLQVGVTSLAVADPTAAVLPAITLDAANGPVTWAAKCVSGDCADVSLSAYDGSIMPADSASVALSFDSAAAAAGGTAVFEFSGSGNVQADVTVTWQAVPLPLSPSSPAGSVSIAATSIPA